MLAAEHSCAIRVSDTLGGFYDYGEVNHSRSRLGGIFVVLVLFGMLIGNQTGHVEDFYLIISGVVMIVLLLLSGRRRRRAWRR